MSEAVEAALARDQARPPEGVSWADGERVLAARREEAGIGLEILRRLGPELVPGQVVLTLDEVLTPAREPGRFHELRTACLCTAQGRRYLSGTDEAFLNQVLAAMLGCWDRSLLVLADGARWIRACYRDCLAPLPRTQMLLDWHHLEQKCRELAGAICPSRPAKARLLRRLYRQLWAGNVPGALRVLAAYRPQAKQHEALDELAASRTARQQWIPNYRARRRRREYIRSGQAEKANDRIVARRQKGRGLQGSAPTRAALAAVRTLLLNGGWDRSWHQREFLPLFAA